MNAVDYSICISGLKSKAGSIPISAMKNITDALLKSSDRILRLVVEGSSIKSGKTPDWLKKTLDFTITGLKTGSTIIEIEAPVLLDTMPEYFEQKKLWDDTYLKPDDSALSLLSKTISDVAAGNKESDFIDNGVLESLTPFKNITKNFAGEISITSRKKKNDNFTFSKQILNKINEIKVTIPKSNIVVVAGLFNLIEHNNRRFQLKMASGKTVNGIMSQQQINLENIRELWGKNVTIKGKANYKPSGTLHSLEAQSIRSFEAGDEIFDDIPVGQRRFDFVEKFLVEKNTGEALKKIWGKWPGDESIEDLLSALQQSPA